ncbi:MAG: gliding motility-associated C-terminal domain-containing protein [Bacteroidota bacterium]
MKKTLLHIVILFLAGISPAFSQSDTTICGGETGALVVRSDYAYESVFTDWEIEGGEIVDGENYGDSVIVQWDKNADTGRVSVKEIGMGGCESAPITMSVDLSNPVIEIFDQEACENDSEIEFIAGGDYEEYEWHDGSSGSSFYTEADTSKSVSVKVTDEYGCTVRDSANLTVYELPDVNIEVITSSDQVFVSEDSVSFVGDEVDEITLDAGSWSSYQWDSDVGDIDGISSSIDVRGRDITDASSSENTDYFWVTVTDENMCTNTDTMAVTVMRQLDIPNAITPNNDGDNDKWKIPALALYPDNVVKIYDRWGDLVYEAKGYDEGKYWDGTDMNGKELPMDSYYYMIDLGTGEKPLFGSVTIIR